MTTEHFDDSSSNQIPIKISGSPKKPNGNVNVYFFLRPEDAKAVGNRVDVIQLDSETWKIVPGTREWISDFYYPGWYSITKTDPTTKPFKIIKSLTATKVDDGILVQCPKNLRWTPREREVSPEYWSRDPSKHMPSPAPSPIQSTAPQAIRSVDCKMAAYTNKADDTTQLWIHLPESYVRKYGNDLKILPIDNENWLMYHTKKPRRRNNIKYGWAYFLHKDNSIKAFGQTPATALVQVNGRIKVHCPVEGRAPVRGELQPTREYATVPQGDWFEQQQTISQPQPIPEQSHPMPEQQPVSGLESQFVEDLQPTPLPNNVEQDANVVDTGIMNIHRAIKVLYDVMNNEFPGLHIALDYTGAAKPKTRS